jgi:hypothetical protein
MLCQGRIVKLLVTDIEAAQNLVDAILAEGSGKWKLYADSRY